MHRTTVIPLADVRRDARIWPRRKLCRELVKELAEIYRHEGTDKIPPIVVARLPGGKRLLIDGWHRVGAAELAGIAHLPVTFVELTSEEAAYEQAVRLSSCGSRMMTAQEKRDAVDRLLATNPDRSDRAIAEIAGVSHPVVARRRALLGKPQKPRGERKTKPRVGRRALVLVKVLQTMAEAAGWDDDLIDDSAARERIEAALTGSATTQYGAKASVWLGWLEEWSRGARLRLDGAGFCQAQGSFPAMERVAAEGVDVERCSTPSAGDSPTEAAGGGRGTMFHPDPALRVGE